MELEDLYDNAYHRALRRDHKALYREAMEERHLFCLPPSRCAAEFPPTLSMLRAHLLRPSPYFIDQLLSLSQHAYHLDQAANTLIPVPKSGDHPSLQSHASSAAPSASVEDWHAQSARILGEETAYNSRDQPFRMLALDRPLVSPTPPQLRAPLSCGSPLLNPAQGHPQAGSALLPPASTSAAHTLSSASVANMQHTTAPGAVAPLLLSSSSSSFSSPPPPVATAAASALPPAGDHKACVEYLHALPLSEELSAELRSLLDRYMRAFARTPVVPALLPDAARRLRMLCDEVLELLKQARPADCPRALLFACVQQHVFTRAHPPLRQVCIQHAAPTQRRLTARLRRCRRLPPTALGLPPGTLSAPHPAPARLLRHHLAHALTPLSAAHLLHQAYLLLTSQPTAALVSQSAAAAAAGSFSASQLGSEPPLPPTAAANVLVSSDEVIPLLARVLAYADPPDLCAVVEYCNLFVFDDLTTSPLGYSLTSYQVTIEYLLGEEFEQLADRYRPLDEEDWHLDDDEHAGGALSSTSSIPSADSATSSSLLGVGAGASSAFTAAGSCSSSSSNFSNFNLLSPASHRREYCKSPTFVVPTADVASSSASSSSSSEPPSSSRYQHRSSSTGNTGNNPTSPQLFPSAASSSAVSSVAPLSTHGTPHSSGISSTNATTTAATISSGGAKSNVWSGSGHIGVDSLDEKEAEVASLLERLLLQEDESTNWLL
mmetsp:Transcript_8993/g.27821  ORF Transcript_8993/g.27821 Transcript_8993/m.27821 type:complete len:718 (-) Transcript_8993:1546-3699(-)